MKCFCGIKFLKVLRMDSLLSIEEHCVHKICECDWIG